MRRLNGLRRYSLLAAMSLTAAVCGCHHAPKTGHGDVAHRLPPVDPAMPRELSKVILPTYRVEPPDILLVEAIQLVPKSPYQLKSLDVLSIQVLGTLPDAPIAGAFAIEPGGVVNLGLPYGSVKVAGLSPKQAEAAITKHLKDYLAEPRVSVALAQMASGQQIAGQHLVGPDGAITLGSYGSVPVVGMTLAEAKAAIEAHLARYLERPEVSVQVFAYNSKAYYIITQGAGLGDGVYRFPVTGNDTVLDAVSQIQGFNQVSSKRIWIARPTRPGHPCVILPVDWQAITEHGAVASNYQLFPGDRLFVAEDKLVAFDTHLAKLLAPLERIMGFAILGAETTTRYSGQVLRGGGNPRSF